jgi:hypothetical protein
VRTGGLAHGLVSPSISGFGRFCCKKILRGALANPLVTYLAQRP